MPEGYSAVQAVALPISAVIACAIFAALGEVFFCDPRYFFVGPLAPDFKAVNRHILAPGIEPIIDRVVGFSFDEVAAAIRYIYEATGKMVIRFE